MSTNFPDEFADKCWALLAEALRRLGEARTAVNVGDFRAFHAPWSSFLKSTGGILNALESGVRSNAQKRQWYGETKNAAKKDQFLAYMHQARNAEEHEPTWTTDVQSGKFKLDGRGGTYASTGSPAMIRISGGKVTLDPGMMRSIEGITPSIEITPKGPRLKPVQDDHGQIFSPPTDFCGRKLSPDDPLAVGEVYAAYLEEIITVALA